MYEVIPLLYLNEQIKILLMLPSEITKYFYNNYINNEININD